MEKIFDAEFYSKLHNLRMAISLHLAGGESGSRKSNAKGSSVEFSDFREYRPGDDFRKVDWNAYGRFERLYLKLFTEEKEGIFNLFLDTSKSMDFGEENKSVAALRLMGALAYIILENSDRVYLNFLGQKGLTVSKSYAGRQAFHKIVEELSNVSFEGENNLMEGISKRKLGCSGMSVLISDGFTQDFEDILKYLIFNKQEVVFIHILSKEELQPSFDGTLMLIDSEDDSRMRITMGAATAKAYKKTYGLFIENIEKLCRKYCVTYIPVSSSDSLDQMFFRSLAQISHKM